MYTRSTAAIRLSTRSVWVFFFFYGQALLLVKQHRAVVCVGTCVWGALTSVAGAPASVEVRWHPRRCSGICDGAVASLAVHWHLWPVEISTCYDPMVGWHKTPCCTYEAKRCMHPYNRCPLGWGCLHSSRARQPSTTVVVPNKS